MFCVALRLENKQRKFVLSFGVPPLRTCRVTLKDVEGVAHHVEVQAASLFEAGAIAVAAFRQHGWAIDALTPAATLRIEVHLPPIAHDVPLKAIERWQRTPSASPRDAVRKQGAATRVDLP